MNETIEATRSIIVEEDFPHAPAVLWQALTDGNLMQQWLMPPTGFAAVVGQKFTFTTKPAGDWDGKIRCQVLEVVPEQRLTYAWASGDVGNQGYGSNLDTKVTMTLTATAAGTRLRLEHAGFAMPRNEVAYQNMSGGWKTVIARFGGVLPDGVQHG